MRSIGRLLALLVFCAGCTSTKRVPLTEMTAQDEPRIVSYTTTDAKPHSFRGRVTVSADSIFLRAIHETAPSGRAATQRDTSLSAQNIDSFETVKFSLPKTMALVATPVVLWFVAFSFGAFQGYNE